MNKEKTIHIISQAHLDLAWMWSWREAWSEALNNITTVVRLMEKYPQLTFSYSNAIIYKWMLESAPKLFEKVQTLVAEGRWEVVGGWMVEADCNLPSGESLLRQAIYGKAFIKEHFNVDVKIGYCPDAFGHCGELPKILKENGFEHYVFSKPRYGENFPHYFRWRASDGSEITTWRIHGGYATGPNDTAATLTESLHYAAKANFPTNCSDTAFFLGLGDHGGGPSEEQIKVVIELDKNPNLPNIKFSTLRDMFHSLNTSCPHDELPIIQNELQPHNIGCYSANGRIKKLNRKTELLIRTAESVSAISSMVFDDEYPENDLQKAWSNLLFNQFHDILAGTCVPACYEEAEESLGSARHAAKEIIFTKLHQMARSVDTSHVTNNAIFAFNPLPHKRRVTLALDMFPTIDGNHGPIITCAIDPETTNRLPIQFAKADCPYGPWNMPWKKLLLSVELPPCGYKSLELKAEPIEGGVVHNPTISLKNNSNTMRFSSLRTSDETEWLKDNGISLVKCGDHSDTFGHGVISFISDGVEQIPQSGSQDSESGPLRWKTSLRGETDASALEMNVFSYAGESFLDLTISGTWNEKNKILKLAISSAIEKPEVFNQTPFGALKRDADGAEVVGQAWTAITGKLDGRDHTLVIINSGIHSFDATDDTLHLTLRRSVQSTHYGEFQRSEEDGRIYLDQGEFSETLRIIPMNGKLNKGAIEKLSQEFQFKAVALIDTAHEGDAPMLNSFLSLTSKNATMVALKQPENEGGIEMRFLEHSGVKENVKVECKTLGVECSISMKPFQLKTTIH